MYFLGVKWIILAHLLLYSVCYLLMEDSRTFTDQVEPWMYELEHTMWPKSFSLLLTPQVLTVCICLVYKSPNYSKKLYIYVGVSVWKRKTHTQRMKIIKNKWFIYKRQHKCVRFMETSSMQTGQNPSAALNSDPLCANLNCPGSLCLAVAYCIRP